MKNYIPYARSDVSRSQVDALVEWLGVDELLAKVRQLPPEAEFYILLDFLVEFSGGLELAEHRMTETLVEQSAISYKAYTEVVKRIKQRLIELYNDDTMNYSKNERGGCNYESRVGKLPGELHPEDVLGCQSHS